MFTCWLAGTPVCRAALVFEDHYEIGIGQYTAASVIPGQTPTLTNATGAWALGSGTVSGNVNGRSSATNLTIPGYVTSGGSAQFFRSDSGTATDNINFRLGASNNAATTLDLGETFYFSALISYTGSHRIGFGLDFEGATIPFGIGFNRTGSIGIMNTTNDGVGNPLLGPVNNGGSAFTAGTYLVVGKVVPNGAGNDTVSLLVVSNNFASVPLSEPSALTSDSSVNYWTTTTNDTLENYWLFAQKRNGTGLTGGIDEFRVASTYLEAIAVPEPATWGLLSLLGCTTLGVWSRRRKVA